MTQRSTEIETLSRSTLVSIFRILMFEANSSLHHYIFSTCSAKFAHIPSSSVKLTSERPEDLCTEGNQRTELFEPCERQSKARQHILSIMCGRLPSLIFNEAVSEITTPTVAARQIIIIIRMN